MPNMNPVVHFEMAYDDKNRVASFYEKVFGWQSQKMGPEMGEYVVATTTETDENRMVKTPGTINGGFFKRTKADQASSIVISVPDIHEAMKKIKEAGGTVLGGGNPNKQSPEEPDDIPGIGLYSSFLDSEGNRVGMLQAKNM